MDKHRHGQGEGHIGAYQGPEGVVQAHVGGHLENGNQGDVHGDGHHGYHAGVDEVAETELHPGERVGREGGNHQHQHQRDGHHNHAAEEIAKEAIGHHVGVVLKIPGVRQVEHTLGEHVKLLAERVQNHEQEGDQGYHQPHNSKEKRDAPCQLALGLTLPVLGLLLFRCHTQ